MTKIFVPQPIPEMAVTRLEAIGDVEIYPHVDRQILQHVPFFAKIGCAPTKGIDQLEVGRFHTSRSQSNQFTQCLIRRHVRWFEVGVQNLRMAIQFVAVDL